ERRSLLPGRLLTPAHQPRTLPAGNDLFLQRGERLASTAGFLDCLGRCRMPGHGTPLPPVRGAGAAGWPRRVTGIGIAVRGRSCLTGRVPTENMPARRLLRGRGTHHDDTVRGHG